jgi:hypothetical protein
MMTPFLAMGFALVLGQVPVPAEEMAANLIDPILRAGYQRVGVTPRFLQREGGKETWDGSMGPQGEWLADALTEALVTKAEGRFQVVNNRRMARAFRDQKLQLDDLADPEVLEKLARQVGGLDALIVGRAVDVRDPAKQGEVRGHLKGSDITCNLIDLRSGDLVGSARSELKITPSLAAYRGEPAGPGTNAFPGATLPDRGMKGPNTPNLTPPTQEGEPIGRTREDGPRADPEARVIPPLDDPRCPLSVKILVSDKPRPFIPVTDPKTGRRELYVELEPGETYQIGIENKAGKIVFASVFVDGINILGKRRDPDNPRHWNVAPGKEFRLSGWYSGEAGQYREEAFVVCPACGSVAIQQGASEQGFTDRIGEILFIVFDTEEGEPKSKGMLPGLFGTAAEKAHSINLEEIPGPKRSNERLASFLIHYAPMSQIEKRRHLKE